MAELVAGKAEDREAVVPVRCVEVLEARVLGREAALAGDVDDEEHLAKPLGERALGAREVPGREVEDVHGPILGDEGGRGQ